MCREHFGVSEALFYFVALANLVEPVLEGVLRLRVKLKPGVSRYFGEQLINIVKRDLAFPFNVGLLKEGVGWLVTRQPSIDILVCTLEQGIYELLGSVLQV